MPGRVLAARAGVIVGPHENIGRLPRWLWRLAEGGEVLAPGPPDGADPADRRARPRGLDARHGRGRRAAAPTTRSAEPGSATWGELLEAVRAVTGGARRTALGRSGVDRGAGRGAVGRAAAVADPVAPRPLRGVGRSRRRGGARAAAAGRRPWPTPGRGWPRAARSTTGARRCARAGSPARPSAGCSRRWAAPKPAANRTQKEPLALSSHARAEGAPGWCVWRVDAGGLGERTCARRSRGGCPRRTSWRERRPHP